MQLQLTKGAINANVALRQTNEFVGFATDYRIKIVKILVYILELM